MAQLDHIFGNAYNDFSSSISRSFSASGSSSIRILQKESLPAGPQDEFLLQKQIRPHFGKEGLNTTPIGTHPDFIALEANDNQTIKHYVCTLFVDIKGSTRLSVLYPPEAVFLFKDAVLKTCVEVIRSLDGHVHRLMGDAVMAFFGGSHTNKENAIADAINCSVTLRSILEQSIRPWMVMNGLDAKDFGFRIGCDFGDDHEVLWGSFGYKQVGEVSATGLPVDMASKLQGLANKNQTMLGQGVLDFVNWPDKYCRVKEREKDGSPFQLPYVTPNITDASGNPINYKMRILDYDRCLDISSLPRSFRTSIPNSKVLNHAEIDFKCFIVSEDDRTEYKSSSYFLDKNTSLEFEVTASTRGRLNFPLSVDFVKTNHGTETPEDERDKEHKPRKGYLNKSSQTRYNKTPAMFAKTVIDERTQYRGLHSMRCDIRDSKHQLVFRDWIGVMIR